MRDILAESAGLMQHRRQVLQQTALEQLAQIGEKLLRLQWILHGSWQQDDKDIALWRESLQPVQDAVEQLSSRIAEHGQADAADCAQLSATRRMLHGLEIEVRAIVFMRMPQHQAGPQETHAGETQMQATGIGAPRRAAA